jgi:hypothetical protein
MLELKLFKLVTGETIICYEPEIIESTANGLEHVFKRPLMLVLQPSDQGIQMGYCLGWDKKLLLKIRQLLLIVMHRRQLNNNILK